MAVVHYDFTKKDFVPVKKATPKTQEGRKQEAKKTTPRKQRTTRNAAQSNERRTLIAKVKIAQKQLNMDDDTYRHMLQNLFKVDSCRDLDNKQLLSLILHFQSKGWEAKKTPAKAKNAKGELKEHEVKGFPLLERIGALLAEKGKVEKNYVPWAYAHSIVKRMTQGRIKDVRQANDAELRSVIAALTADAKKSGRYVP